RRLAGAALAAAACARVEIPPEADGGTAGPPRIADLQPPPGDIDAEAQFHVVFSEAMDEGQLLASTGRSETVVLAPDELVERAGATAAASLSGRLVSVADGGGAVSVVGPSGALASAAASKGILELPLCPAWAGSGCAALRAGQTYSLALDGKPVPGATFVASQC